MVASPDPAVELAAWILMIIIMAAIGLMAIIIKIYEH